MKRMLKRWIGAEKPKIIAVVAITRDEAEAGFAHALTAGGALPIHVWCAEKANPFEGCAGFVSEAGAFRVWRDLRAVWPALSIVAWTGTRGFGPFKLAALVVPPFRVVAFNEAHGFFAAGVKGIADHLGRRVRDAWVSGVRRIGDWIGGAGQWTASFVYRTADRIESSLLAMLAAIAAPTASISRRAVKRVSVAGITARIQPERTVAQSAVEVAIPNRGWARSAVRRAVEASDAEFVVFRMRGEVASAEPLIALAAESNAFAAARQIAWAGWRDVVASKHPFRRLQPGEFVQVAAPYSTLVVIRRDLLLRLGVPRALTYGAALMVLFRKAAAAGLTSLVMGYGEALTDESAMALEDLELALRLTLSSSLRRSPPAPPEQTGGNLAQSQLHRREFRGKPRVLVVSPYLPYPLSHGGAVRIYNLCRAMASDIDFVLACFREANETVCYAELHEVFREVYAVDANEKHLNTGVPSQVAEYRNSAMADLVGRMCVERKVDLLQLEYTQMAEYRQYAAGVPVILVEHDLTFTLHSQLADVLPEAARRRQYELWLAFEEQALRDVDAVWTMSTRDRELACEHGAEWELTAVVPNGVDLRRFQPLTRQTTEQTILFVGSFRHLPNLLAFETLCDRIMPEVWAACPEAKLHVIAGPNHVSAVKMAGKLRLLNADPRIQVEGFVEDVAPAYRECDVVAIPLPVSAGTNIKLMEAMACGLPVISTPVGCQGLSLRDATDLLIRDIGAEFSSAITLLLWDDGLRRRMGANARHAAVDRFDWNAAAGAAMTSYASLLTGPAPESMTLARLSI